MKTFSIVVIRHSISILLNVNSNTKTNSVKCKVVGTLVDKILPEYYTCCILSSRHILFVF